MKTGFRTVQLVPQQQEKKNTAVIGLTENDDERHFDGFDLGAWDDASRAGPSALLIFIQHGRSGTSAHTVDTLRHSRIQYISGICNKDNNQLHVSHPHEIIMWTGKRKVETDGSTL